jgi:hypothetical protein
MKKNNKSIALLLDVISRISVKCVRRDQRPKKLFLAITYDQRIEQFLIPLNSVDMIDIKPAPLLPTQ